MSCAKISISNLQNIAGISVKQRKWIRHRELGSIQKAANMAQLVIGESVIGNNKGTITEMKSCELTCVYSSKRVPKISKALIVR